MNCGDFDFALGEGVLLRGDLPVCLLFDLVGDLLLLLLPLCLVTLWSDLTLEDLVLLATGLRDLDLEPALLLSLFLRSGYGGLP